jgi:hypothetical protein
MARDSVDQRPEQTMATSCNMDKFVDAQVPWMFLGFALRNRNPLLYA